MIVSSSAEPTTREIQTIRLEEPDIRGARSLQPLEWVWEPYDGRSFGHYELIRVDGNVKSIDLGAAFDVVATVAVVGQTSVIEGTPLDRNATYQLRVFDRSRGCWLSPTSCRSRSDRRADPRHPAVGDSPPAPTGAQPRPVAGGTMRRARWRVVQSAERLTLDQEVAGSIPAPPAMSDPRRIRCL